MIRVLDEGRIKDSKLYSLKAKLGNLGVKFKSEKQTFQDRSVSEKRKKIYTDILQRKNTKYSFYDIEVYADPYESNNLTTVNQMQIIEEIVQNAEKR